MPVTITAQGLIELWHDGALVSNHADESKAIESALAHAEANGNGDSELRFPHKVVTVSLLTKTVVPFAWRSVDVQFREGTAFSVDLSTFLDNPEGHAIVYSTSSLPSGVTLNGSQVSYNGTGGAASRTIARSHGHRGSPPLRDS